MKDKKETPKTQTRIYEGYIKKGGLNQRPTTPRPAPPKGQGGKKK